jgi:hypothetical protein
MSSRAILNSVPLHFPQQAEKLNGWYFIITVVLPIAIGSTIYILFRSTRLYVFHWIDWMQIANPIMLIRMKAAHFVIPNQILYSLPDGIWVFSGTSALLYIWDGYKSWLSSIWISIPFLAGMVMEFGQGLNLVPGTFSIADLVYNICAFTLSIITAYLWSR